MNFLSFLFIDLQFSALHDIMSKEVSQGGVPVSEKTIYLIRHAHPDLPEGVKKMCLGRKNDLPLSELGHSQACALARRFAAIPLEAVYTSPLLRARQTAQAIAGDARPLYVLEDLIELDGGEWDGLTFDELHERYPHAFGPGARSACPPGGESDESGLARMQKAFDLIIRNTRNCAAVVAHSGVNRLFLCALSGMPLSEKKKMGQDHAAVAVLTYQSGTWAIREYARRNL